MLDILVPIVNLILTFFSFVLLFRALISWFPIDRENALVRFLHMVTEPILEPIRRLLPPSSMMDFSPLVAMIIIIVLRQMLQFFYLN